jgi:hypothetical protein
MIALAQRFSSLLPTIFPPEPSLSTMLVIPDLHEGNVLVNDRGDIVAVLDWEFSIIAPDWAACRVPRLFDLNVRDVEPTREYFADYPELFEQDWVHYDMSIIYRQRFLDTMDRIQPSWNAVRKAGAGKRSLEHILGRLRDRQGFGEVTRRWVNTLVEGGWEALADVSYSCGMLRSP